MNVLRNVWLLGGVLLAACAEPPVPAAPGARVAPVATEASPPVSAPGTAGVTAPVPVVPAVSASAAAPAASASAAAPGGRDGDECDASHPCAAGITCVYPCGVPGCKHKCMATPPSSPYPRSR